MKLSKKELQHKHSMLQYHSLLLEQEVIYLKDYIKNHKIEVAPDELTRAGQFIAKLKENGTVFYLNSLTETDAKYFEEISDKVADIVFQAIEDHKNPYKQ